MQLSLLVLQVLEKNFKLHHIEVLDTSDNYHLPGNSEKFLTILMVSDQFQNKTEYEVSDFHNIKQDYVEQHYVPFSIIIRNTFPYLLVMSPLSKLLLTII